MESDVFTRSPKEAFNGHTSWPVIPTLLSIPFALLHQVPRLASMAPLTAYQSNLLRVAQDIIRLWSWDPVVPQGGRCQHPQRRHLRMAPFKTFLQLPLVRRPFRTSYPGLAKPGPSLGASAPQPHHKIWMLRETWVRCCRLYLL
ncbi:hypothetical protein C8J57DRAFT_1309898, partial [Mycena rebaudengoi]